jgi:hypothetical protein
MPKEKKIEYTQQHPMRPNGAGFEQMKILYEEICKSEKYIVFKSARGTVHILPEDKLKEIKEEYRQQGYEEGRAVERERIVGNVGVLRQLLNEERLPADKMIDNRYIERCLELSALSSDPTGE